MTLGKVVALCGGVGGARLAHGLAQVIAPEQLTAIVNVGDDFTHLGMRICPDLDTVLYTLAGRENSEAGWGRSDESWAFLETLEQLGGDAWFRLGDRDTALHIWRTEKLREGLRLTEATSGLAAAFGVKARLLPATDDTIATLCATSEGVLPFQEYFVRRRCEPTLKGLTYSGAEQAQLTPEVRTALADPHLSAVVLCPSNPYLSIEPILAIPGMREALRAISCPRIAVSPIIGGRAVKGPLAKIMSEYGQDVTAEAVARHYAGLIDLFVCDPADADFRMSGVALHGCDVMMRDAVGRGRLAREVLSLVGGGRG